MAFFKTTLGNCSINFRRKKLIKEKKKDEAQYGFKLLYLMINPNLV
jgi:hypothetical protein